MAHDLDPELHTIPPDRCEMESQPTWRRDLPHRFGHGCLCRSRDFTKFLGLTSLASGRGTGLDWSPESLAEARGKWPIVAIGELENLKVGGALVVPIPDRHRSGDPAAPRNGPLARLQQPVHASAMSGAAGHREQTVPLPVSCGLLRHEFRPSNRRPAAPAFASVSRSRFAAERSMQQDLRRLQT